MPQWGGLFILVKGLTPIPYKLVTIVSGLLDYNFLLFIAAVADHARRALLHPRRPRSTSSAIRSATGSSGISACSWSCMSVIVVGGFWLAGEDASELLATSRTPTPPASRLAMLAVARRRSRGAWIFEALGYRPANSA